MPDMNSMSGFVYGRRILSSLACSTPLDGACAAADALYSVAAANPNAPKIDRNNISIPNAGDLEHRGYASEVLLVRLAGLAPYVIPSAARDLHAQIPRC